MAEWSEVKYIKKDGHTPLCELVFIIMGQKNVKMVVSIPDSECPFRARAVFQGSNVFTGDGTPAWMAYQEAGATPSNMATAHCAMGDGALKGSRATTRDAKKAYIQSSIDVPGRPRTLVRLLSFYGQNYGSMLAAPVNIETLFVSSGSRSMATRRVDPFGTRK